MANSYINNYFYECKKNIIFLIKQELSNEKKEDIWTMMDNCHP